MNKQIANLLADVLHCANSRPPHIKEREFYALKDRLLEQYCRWRLPFGCSWSMSRNSFGTCSGISVRTRPGHRSAG